MLRLFCTIFILSCLLGFGTASAAPRIKVFKLSITNPSDQVRLAEDVVISIAELKRIAPDFKAGDAIVTTSDASTLEEDARTLQTTELPSQADDLDGDNQYDELVFQIDLKPKQTRIVTIAYGETATIQRLRSEYPKRTAAKFTMKFDGLGWESEATSWRIYFDKRNAIDVWGKRRPGLYLEMFGAPEYVYNLESPFGRDHYCRPGANDRRAELQRLERWRQTSESDQPHDALGRRARLRSSRDCGRRRWVDAGYGNCAATGSARESCYADRCRTCVHTSLVGTSSCRRGSVGDRDAHAA